MNKQVKISLEDILPLINEGFKNNQVVDIKVIGNSMKPFLIDHESIVGLQKHSNTLTKHHIYFFRVANTYILHRYIKTINNIAYFRGDALYKYEKVDKEDVLAEVIYVKRNDKEFNPYNMINKVKLFFYLLFKCFKNIIRKILR